MAVEQHLAPQFGTQRAYDQRQLASCITSVSGVHGKYKENALNLPRFPTVFFPELVHQRLLTF